MGQKGPLNKVSSASALRLGIDQAYICLSLVQKF